MVVQVLYVDQLPEGYKDMAEFRKIFSQLVSPPYCQVAVHLKTKEDFVFDLTDCLNGESRAPEH
jgi:hypothetical protein